MISRPLFGPMVRMTSTAAGRSEASSRTMSLAAPHSVRSTLIITAWPSNTLATRPTRRFAGVGDSRTGREVGFGYGCARCASNNSVSLSAASSGTQCPTLGRAWAW
jgi:hypothetical protein